ncbi:MAG: helix-turn-helix transcriptional regulator, partial [Verrucomicrobiae bacterium]|nr:helix-turn-helix transcriptional regulator [Verrucomicrobiae bacterium]
MNATPSALPGTLSTVPKLNPDRVLASLANPMRWQFVQLLADGRAWSASDVANRFDRDFDGVSKHLRVLRSAGVLASRRGIDRRQELFFVPNGFRQHSGHLDLGFCLLRVPQARPDDALAEPSPISASPIPVSASPPATTPKLKPAPPQRINPIAEKAVVHLVEPFS